MEPERVLPITGDMTYGDMRRAVDHTPVTVFSTPLPGNLMGLYKESTQTIAIDLNLTYTQKRCTLTHELWHWHYGDLGCTTKDRKTEMRARRKTALLLIDPVEYATVEQMFEGEPTRMALELNVTMQVLSDYRNMLHEGVVVAG